MKTTQSDLEYLERKNKDWQPSSSKEVLLIKPYENVLEDLEALRLTEAILSTKTIQELINVLKPIPYLYLPQPTSTKDIIIDLEIIHENMREQSGFLFRFTLIVKRLPSQYAIKAKIYELLYTM